MPIILRENVIVSDTETEIIEPQETDHDKNRIFSVSNGDNEVELKAFGRNDGDEWSEKDSLVLSANDNGMLTVGPHVCWVKLIGQTTSPGTSSKVDASLTY